MNIKIKKENIKRYAAGVAIATIVGSSVGLTIGCKRTDHTKELCPVTKLLNMLPDYKNAELEYSIPQGVEHQLEYLVEDYNRKMDDPQNELATTEDDEERILLGSTYGKIVYTEELYKTYLDGTEEIYENEYFGGEYGITSYFNDGTKNILVFNNNGEPDKTRNFQLKKVNKPSR